MSEQILFVAMNGKGVKSSIIRAHAAKKGHERSRQNLAKQSPEAKDSKKASSTAKSTDATTKAKARRKASANLPAEPTIAKSRKTSHVRPDEDDEAKHIEKQLVKSTQKETPSPFQIWLPSCMSDRFVQMFFETMMPSYTAAYDAFNVPNIIKQEWPLYMNHEVFLWTEAAAIQGLYESLQNPEKPPSQKVFLYKAKALQCLKQELMKTKNGKLDDYLVMSIFVIASLDLMAGDEIAHDAHKKILRTAFAAAGGLHNYGSFVRNTTMRLDSFWRSTPTEPIEPAVPLLLPSRAPRLPSHPFAPQLVDIIGSLPVGFSELALQRKLPLDVLEVLGRIADPSQKPLPAILTTDDNRSPMSSCGMYLDFWESCPSLSSTAKDSNGEPPLERLISLALLIYATNRDASNPLRMYNCVTNGAIYDLCHDLPQCERQRSKEEEHCLFWIWSIAVDAQRDRFGVLTNQGTQLLEQQKKRFPGVIGTGVEEKVLERFWFSSEHSNGSCLYLPSPYSFQKGQTPPKLQRSNTNRYSEYESASSPSASATFGRTESIDGWSVRTPSFEKEQNDVEIARSGSSQADDTESVVSKWHGPGFGLLPKGNFVERDMAPDLTYGRIDGRRTGSVRCVAG